MLPASSSYLGNATNKHGEIVVMHPRAASYNMRMRLKRLVPDDDSPLQGPEKIILKVGSLKNA